MSFSEPDTDILVPAFDVRALARRAAVPAALAATAAAALVVAGGPLHAFAHALRRALDADPRWVIGGASVRAAVLRRLHRPLLDGRQPREASASA